MLLTLLQLAFQRWAFQNIERSWLIKDQKFVVSELEIILIGLHAYLDKRDFLKTFFLQVA